MVLSSNQISTRRDGHWFEARLVSGHGVASGRSADSPYPMGTIAMQQPLFASLGLDLSDCWPGTLNLCFQPLEIGLEAPDHTFVNLHWTDRHPPETFSFWRIALRSARGQECPAWIYRPHPETKQRHWQPPTLVEVLAPPIDHLSPGDSLWLHDPQDRLVLIDGVRLRARLLEALKFRVLAAEERFFEADSTVQRRRWLATVHPEALALSDADLERVWYQARSLYGSH